MPSLVMTVIGPDRPGLVEELSRTITAHRGNWLESRMAHLAGHFAGLLHVECPPDSANPLTRALQSLAGLTVHVAEELGDHGPATRIVRFDVVGNDRPGIIQQLSSAIVRAGGNVEELNSYLESAPHAGHSVFRATGRVAVPEDFDENALNTSLEALGPDLAVSLEA